MVVVPPEVESEVEVTESERCGKAVVHPDTGVLRPVHTERKVPGAATVELDSDEPRLMPSMP